MSTEKFTFFWHGPFSQWHLQPFSEDGRTFNCAEQYMMFHKAMLFNDEQTAQAVMEAQTPKQQKALGRKVTPFDADKWNEKAREIVYQGNYLKFTQNPDLLETLMATEGTTIVEASPLDCIWGIGLAENNAKAHNRDTWRGSNWLGEVLTKLRENLKKA